MTQSAELSGLKIGDLARLTGKTSRALRLYEEMGLLTPSERSAGNFRLYDQTALERVQFISSLQELGFSLAEVCDFIQVAAEHDVPKTVMAHLRGRFATTLDDVRGKLERLQSLERELQGALAYLDSCQGCALTHDGPSACAACDTQRHDAPKIVREATLTAAAQHSHPVSSDAVSLEEGVS